MVGRVRGLHGTRGRVRVELLTDRPEERFALGAVLRGEDDDRPLTISESRPVPDGPGWWLRFDEVADRTAAEDLRDRYLVADVPADELGPEEVYWHQLIGVEVTDPEGRAIGTVADVYRAGEAEVIIVAGTPWGTLDIPLVGTIIRGFAPRSGRIVVDPEALDLPSQPVGRKPRGRRTRRAAEAAASADEAAATDDGAAATVAPAGSEPLP